MSLLSRIERLEAELNSRPPEIVCLSYPWDQDPKIYADRWVKSSRVKGRKPDGVTLIMVADYRPPKPKWSLITEEKSDEPKEARKAT